MLVGSRPCSMATQYYVQAEKVYMEKKFLDPNDPQMLLTLRGYINLSGVLKGADEAVSNYSYEAARVLGLDEDAVKEHTLILAHYGMALYGSFFAYDLGQENVDKRMSLYTTSISLLQNLANKGILIDKKKDINQVLQEVEKKLYGGVIQKKLKDDDTLYAARLDPVVTGRNVQFTVTVPRTPVKLSTHMIMSYDVVKTALDMFDQILRNNMLRITMGDKVRVVSKNTQVLNTVYNADGKNAHYIDSVLSEGYDTRTLKFYCPVIGASRYTSGTTNIRVTEIDKIEQVGIADVDLSDVNVNLMGVRLEALEQLKAKRGAYSKVAKYLQLEDSSVESVETAVNDMYDADIWKMMKDLPKVFSCDLYKSKPNRYGSLYEPQVLPISQQNLSELLKTGVYKILLRKQNGSFSTIITTSNKSLLTQILGDDYEGRLESDGVRYRKAIEAVKKGMSVEEAIKKFNTPEVVGKSKDDYISMLEVELINVSERTTVVPQANLLVVKRLDATSPKNFYAHVNVNNIKELIKLQ